MVTRTRRWMGVSVAIIAAAIAAAVPMRAQQAAGTGAQASRALTAGDYARAEKFMTCNTTPLVLRSGVRPTWLPDGRSGIGSRQRKGARRSSWTRSRRPRWPAICRPAPPAAPPGVARAAGGGRGGGGRGARATDAPSPDGKRAVFIRDWNLWVRDIATARKRSSRRTASRISATPPTTPAGRAATGRSWCGRRTRRRSRPSSRTSAASARCTWSSTRVGHPKLQAWKYPLPGDDVVTMIQRVVIDVGRGARSCASRWSPTSTAPRCATTSPAAAATGRTCSGRRTATQLAFVSTSRDHKQDDAARRRCGDRRGARRAGGDGRRRSSSRATAASTGVTCRRRTR